MSMVSTALGRRTIDAHTPLGHPAATSLADLRPGATAQIVAVDTGTDPAAARRLFDLGFAPGEQVQMLRRAPLADPVVFRIAGYDIALRRAQARRIAVCASLEPSAR